MKGVGQSLERGLLEEVGDRSGPAGRRVDLLRAGRRR